MKLSVVTVSMNAEGCISKTIDSILNQTVPVYEYIMIDGKSKDRTYDIICSYDHVFEERGIRFIHISEPDKGISDAFNKGIARATGDLIGLINADDELMPETNRVLSETWEKGRTDVYYGNCWWVDEKRKQEYISYPKHDLKELLYNMVLIHPSTFITKNTYDECGCYSTDYKYCMDEELLYRLYKAGRKFQYVDAELTRFKAGGVSDTHASAVFKEGTKMALSYGAPLFTVKLIEIKKTIKDGISRMLKNTHIYWKLKKSRKI